MNFDCNHMLCRDMNFRTTYYIWLPEFMKTVAVLGNHWSKDTAKIHIEWEMFFISVALKLSLFKITRNEHIIYILQTYTMHLWVFFWVSAPPKCWNIHLWCSNPKQDQQLSNNAMKAWKLYVPCISLAYITFRNIHYFNQCEIYMMYAFNVCARVRA